MAQHGRSLLEPIRNTAPKPQVRGNNAPRRAGGTSGSTTFPTLWEDICEQGFARSIGRIGIDVCEEVNHATLALREEIACVSSLAPAVAEIQKAVQELHQKLESHRQAVAAATFVPAVENLVRKADLSALGDEIQRGDSRKFQSYVELVEGVEARLLRNMQRQLQEHHQEVERNVVSQVRQDILAAVQQTDEAVTRAQVEVVGQVSETQKAIVKETEKGVKDIQETSSRNHRTVVDLMEAQIDDLRRRTEAKMSSVIDVQRVLEHQCSQHSKGLRDLQKKSNELSSSLDVRVDALLTKHVHETSVNVDFSDLSNRIGHMSNTACQNYTVIVGELGKIQQSMHVDFAQVVDDLHGLRVDTKKKLKDLDQNEDDILKAKKRMREYWTQTDTNGVQEGFTQTDEWLIKQEEKKPAKKRAVKKTATDRVQETVKAKPVFADHDAIKQKMRAAMIQKQYNVMDMYHTTGIAQHIARSWVFEQITMVVILVNAIWIAVDTDYNDADVLINADPIFQIVEHSFCAYFSFELLTRFFAFNGKRNCLRDAWFMFDTLLVLLMVLETWVITIIMLALGPSSSSGLLGNASILRMVRMVRILRVSRMARLLRAIPELVILIKGIGVASRSVTVFFVLWFMIIYVFGVVFRQLTADSDIGSTHFQTVPVSMNTLLLEGVLPDNSDIVNKLASTHALLWPLIMFFIALAAVTIMYMLIGVLVDVIRVISTSEKEGMMVSLVASQLRGALEEAGKTPDAPLSKFEFQGLLERPDIAGIIRNAGADVIALVDMSDLVFEDEDKATHGLRFEDFVDMVLNLRGNNPSTVKDVKEQIRIMKKFVFGAQEEIIKTVRKEILKLRDDMREMQGDDDDDYDAE